MNLVDQIITADKTIGSTDESRCLPGWIESFCKWHEAGEGCTLSPSAVSALLHTLVAAKVRTERLVKERDAKSENQ